MEGKLKTHGWILFFFFIKVQNFPMQKYWIQDTFFKFPIENLYFKRLWIFKFSRVLECYFWPIREAHNFYKIVLLIIWLFDVYFAIQGLKMAKTKVLSRDMRDRIIERHKGGHGYRKISKEMILALSTVGNIIRKYKKYGDGTANLPRNGRPRKTNERTSRWILAFRWSLL